MSVRTTKTQGADFKKLASNIFKDTTRITQRVATANGYSKICVVWLAT